MLKTTISAARPDGDQNSANGQKRQAIGDVPEVDVTDNLYQIKESLKQISSTHEEITKDIVILNPQNYLIDFRLRYLQRRTSLPESLALPTELSQLISTPPLWQSLYKSRYRALRAIWRLSLLLNLNANSGCGIQHRLSWVAVEPLRIQKEESSASSIPSTVCIKTTGNFVMRNAHVWHHVY